MLLVLFTLDEHAHLRRQKTKAVVTPAWLRDSVAQSKALPCHNYVAVPDLQETTVKHCPDCNCKPCACSDDAFEAATPRLAGKQLPSPPSSPSASVKNRDSHTTTVHEKKPTQPVEVPMNLLPPDPPIPTNLEKLDYMSRYACQRASPLVCPNQALVRELDVIRRSRALEGEERSSLSYQRAASVIKGLQGRCKSLTLIQPLE